MLRSRRDYWLSRVLVTSEMDNKGLPASGLESEGQLGPFPPLMMPPRVGAEGGGAVDGTRRCCCWCCCPVRCPCRFPSPFPQLTGVCCNRKYVSPLFTTLFALSFISLLIIYFVNLIVLHNSFYKTFLLILNDLDVSVIIFLLSAVSKIKLYGKQMFEFEINVPRNELTWTCRV